jgi:nitroreductase
MTHTLPPEPAFGAPCPVRPSPDTLELMAERRSSSAQLLTAPGPDADQIGDLLRLATRVPDHGKMAPWRFVVMQGAPKADLVERLRSLAAQEANPGKAEAALAKLSAPPVSILVVSAPREGGKPVWEQEMSAGAVCMNLLLACEAMGFGANWITDWYSYAPAATALLGLRAGERVAGFIHVGTAPEPPLERLRPDLTTLVAHL